MLNRSRRFIGPAAVAAALAIGALGAAPVAAQTTSGALTVDVMSGAVVDKDGTITLRAKYACGQYDAPYDGTDLLIASITSSTGGYHANAAVTCDGTTQHITLHLIAFNGGVSGSANLQFGHQGNSPDGTIGTIAGYVDIPIKVVSAGK